MQPVLLNGGIDSLQELYILKIVEFFSLPQDDFRSVEKLENAENPHKLYVFVRSRRFFYRLCQ